ncbi:CHAT domain-containing protein [Actinomadura bangladeshensis]|uniref:CHAT domain-containing protein n=1 Tax=Actinomadura bangladeshensis TaxID=453573 RepID=A0A6L9QHI0_9ACTN|nr:CHAT domain-containing protein [Actinomadura bangladeshensis]NEA24562.1 CHAT domain-containing protein [Actinomadura bangladeshensis]
MMPEWDVAEMIDRRMALAREWEQLVKQVRGLDGFADFLRPPRLSTLLPAAAEGPVAVVNLSQRRCDVLLVRPDGVEVEGLSSLTLESVVDRTNDYLGALRRYDQATWELYLARRRFDDGDNGPDTTRQYTRAKKELVESGRIRDRTLRDIHRWLWDEIAERTLAALGLTAAPGPGQLWPRLWWCPTGPLTLLPLHAAGHHGAAGDDAVLDRAVSSYTPTLRALLEARRPMPQAPEHERMLIVALPDAPEQVPLENVVRERDLIVSLFPDRHTLLDESATTGVVRAELSRHRWAHFSCHGSQNLADPSQGGLILRDESLTIADVSAQQHDGEFAFLSACMTAVGGVRLPDEAITLAAALHFTGYRQVIGTMWAVHDQTAADVAAMVYTDLTATGRFDPKRSARSLHAAIRHLRDVAGAPAHAWTPFIHLGA